MRKWIVTGVVAAVVIGVAAVTAFVLARRQQESIEYHKRQYLQERAGQQIFGRFVDRKTQSERMNVHRDALIQLGYLEECTFVISNRARSEVLRELYRAGWNKSVLRDIKFLRIAPQGSNMIYIAAIKEDIPKWKTLVREADVK